METTFNSENQHQAPLEKGEHTRHHDVGGILTLPLWILRLQGILDVSVIKCVCSGVCNGACAVVCLRECVRKCIRECVLGSSKFYKLQDTCSVKQQAWHV